MILQRLRSGISEEVQAELGPRLGHGWATATGKPQHPFGQKEWLGHEKSRHAAGITTGGVRSVWW